MCAACTTAAVGGLGTSVGARVGASAGVTPLGAETTRADVIGLGASAVDPPATARRNGDETSDTAAAVVVIGFGVATAAPAALSCEPFLAAVGAPEGCSTGGSALGALSTGCSVLSVVPSVSDDVPPSTEVFAPPEALTVVPPSVTEDCDGVCPSASEGLGSAGVPEAGGAEEASVGAPEGGVLVGSVVEAWLSPAVCEPSTFGVAHPVPGVVATAAPTPNATASAPTRPICLAYPIVSCLSPEQTSFAR